MKSLRAIVQPGLLLCALLSFVPLVLSAGPDDLEKIRALRRQLENSPAATPEQVRPALENIAVSLERGWKSEAEALALAVERTAGSWSNSPAGNALRLELQFRQAQILVRQCQVEPARKRFEELRGSIVANLPDLTADLDDELGIIAAWEGHFAKALTNHLATVSIRRARREDSGLGRSLNLLGAVQLTLGRNTEAAASFDEAQIIFDRSHDERGSAITRLNRAVLLRAKGELRAAHSELSGVTVFARTNGHPDIEADALANDAAVLEGVGRYQEALGLAEASLQLQKQMENCRALARLHSTLGVLAQKTGDFKRANEEFNTALKLAREHGDRAGELTARNNLGWLKIALQQPAAAREIFTALRDERRATGDRAGTADALANLGSAQLKLKQRTEARASFDEALRLRRRLSDTNGIASLLINLGRCDVEDGRVKQAIPRLQEAQRLATMTDAQPLEATAWNSLGYTFKITGRLEEARAAYEQARSLRVQMGDPVAEAVTLNNLMALAQAQEQPRLGIYYGKRAVARFQDVRTNLLWLEVEAQRSFTAFCQPCYRRLADLLIETGRLPEAEQVLNMLKREEFHEFMRRDAGQAGEAIRTADTAAESWATDRDATFAARTAELSLRWRQLLQKTKAGRTVEEEKEFRNIEFARARLAKDYEKFLEELKVELGANRKDEARQVAEAEGLQRLLLELRDKGAGETAVLYTLVVEKRYRVILITPDLTRDFKTDIAEPDLNQKVWEFRQVLSDDRHLPDALPKAQELYRILLCNGAVDAVLRANKIQTVMWSLDGALRYLPMAALHDGTNYLAERFRNSVITPASLSRLSPVAHREWKGLGLGVSEAHEVELNHGAGKVEKLKFGQLDKVPRELHYVIRDNADGADGAVPGKIMLDGDFTESSLRDALETSYEVVHIASHFYFRPGDEASSFLLLGDGHTLSVAQLKLLQNLFERVDLLTLSACDTAMGGAANDAGGLGEGKEVDSLGELAQRKGAAAIVATLWPVNDESTSLLMREFYQLRQTNPGWPKAETLRQAQIKLLHGAVKPTQPAERRAAKLPGNPEAKTVTDFSHPYFWAPFVLTGNWQ